MSVTTNVNQIKLNIMTKAQYNAATKSASELYMVTDAEDSSIQVDTLPTASVDVLGKIYQYVGTTTASCTNGYFYKCVSDGAVTPTYSWQQVEVQPAGSSSLPSQTGNAGKFLTTDGTDASWGDALHLSGGTLTGNLEISTGSSITFPGTSTYSQSISNSGSTSLLFESTYSPSWGLFMDLGRSEIRGIYDGYGKLGSSNYHWGEGYINDLYATKINNGGDIDIPTTSGTMALTSDIPTVDQTYNSSSANPQSGTAVAGAISSAISSVYKAAGSVTFANLPNLSSSIEGYVYDISDSFTTTADFVEGAGNTYPAGTNVVCINTAASGQTAVYKWDVLSALADLSGYLPLTGGELTGTLNIKGATKPIIFKYNDNTDKNTTIRQTGDGLLIGHGNHSVQTKEYLFSWSNVYNGFLPINWGGSSPNLGHSSYKWTKTYTTKLNNGADINIPNISGTIAIQDSTLPTADSTNEGMIVQYTGTTDSTHTNGYFYKCVSDGAVTPTYSWINVEVQPAGDSLPSQTGNAGKFLTTDGTDASWSDTPLVNKATDYGIAISSNGNNVTSSRSIAIGNSAKATGAGIILERSIAIGHSTQSNNSGTIAVGHLSKSNGSGSIAIGHSANATADGAIQIGSTFTTGGATNSVANTLKIANTNGNFEMMSADGTIPTDRYTTTPSSDGNYVPTLSISSGTTTRSWTSIASSVSSSSTNAETVGAKLFYDTVGDIVTLINAL